MADWIVCKDFIEADVIRWTEAVWERRSAKAKALKIATRRVTAEVLRDDAAGWVRLLVRNCEILERFTRKDAGHLRDGQEIKRKRPTITRGKPQRLVWSDESARAALVAERRPVRTQRPKRR